VERGNQLCISSRQMKQFYAGTKLICGPYKRIGIDERISQDRFAAIGWFQSKPYL
jgi:hypothetical protein